MNLSQLLALAKLRYRLTVNQIKKSGKFNTVLAAIFYSLGAFLVATSFFFAAILGTLFYSQVDPFSMIMMWNIIAATFLFLWMMQLVAELQQTEMISLDKLLHMPVSLKGAFFLNYTSTFFNGTFLFFAPAMLGMCVGMIFGLGWRMAISLPLVLSFLFLVTSLTHQLRGWLGGLMENKRSKGTIGALVIIGVIAVTQIPHLAIQYYDRVDDKRKELVQNEIDEKRVTAVAMLDARHNPNDLTAKTSTWEVLEIDRVLNDQKSKVRAERKKQGRVDLVNTVQTVDKFVPPGWMPLGIFRAYQGSLLPGILGSLGMFVMGLVSFTMSYRSSMRKYTGATSRRKVPQKETKVSAPKLDFLFKNIPLCSQPISTVAFTTFRSMIRAPETKMMLIMPVVIAVLGCGYFLSGNDFTIPEQFWPCIPIGAIALTMFTIASSTFNQFGMDRDGFRAFVLSPLKRRDILIGKNLALFPLAGGVAILFLVILQFIFPVGPTACAANLLQIPCNFFLYCLAGNTASIYFPMGIKRGSMQPVNPKFLPMLILVLATFMLPTFLFMPTCAVLTLPLFLEFHFGWNAETLYLIGTIIQLIATLTFYWYIIKFQGHWLWKREPKILDQVANVPE